MECLNCKKRSRCGCSSCKSRVRFPVNRAYKITGMNIGIIQCPYCRKRYSEEQLLDIAYAERIKMK